MKTNSKVVGALIAVAMGAGAFAQVANATTATETNEAQTVSNTILVPATGITILDGVHRARVALFDGNIDAAKELITGASEKFDDHAAKYVLKMPGDAGYGIPVDSGLQFAEGFQPTNAHTPAIAEAGQHAQNGDVETAVTIMTEAGIDLDVKVVVLPVATVTAQLKQALADIEAGHFHKANMALKAVETSVVVEDYKPDALPTQGYALDEILQG